MGGFISAIPARTSGQEILTASSDTHSVYDVQKGTTLWNLAKELYGDGNHWSEIYRLNVQAGFLSKKDYSYNAEKDWPMVMLRPGQRILLKNPVRGNNIVKPEKVSSAGPAIYHMSTPRQEKSTIIVFVEKNWLWMFLAALALLVVWGIMRKLSNPTTAGPAVRRGGINDQSAPDYFRQLASEQTRSQGGESVSPEQIQIINMLRGRGYGIMRVGYRDGRSEIKRLNGEAVYQATVQFPDGHQEMMYCLQACANDIRYIGTRYGVDRLFRFEAETSALHTDPPVTRADIGGHSVSFTADEITVTTAGQTFSFEADGVRRDPEGGIVVSAAGRRDVLLRNGRIYGAPIKSRKERARDKAEKSGQFD
jgi:hypothetical protein